MKLQDLQKSVTLGRKSGDTASFVNTLYDSTLKYYLKQHRDWYINRRFVRGDHWIVYNKTLNRVQQIPAVEGEVRRTINKVRVQKKGIKNLIKRSQPRWEVKPNDATPESFNEAKSMNHILQDFYETRQFPSLMSGIISNGLDCSVGILEGGIIKKEGKDYLDFWVDDTFDILFDPTATSKESCRFILKLIKKPISSIEEDPTYTYDGKITPDGRDGGSDFKDLLEKEKYAKQGSTSSDLDTVIVKELWLKYYDKEGNTKIKVLTIVGDQVVKDQETSYKRYPFFLYNPDAEPNSIYSDPWIKDIISPNKSLDKTVSQIETYISRMLAGKYIIKQGVEVSSITDKGAEKIYYKGNVPPTQQQLQPLPSTPFNYIDNLGSWIEDSGGISAASLGRSPASLQSGRGLEALQAADASNASGPVENLEIFLGEVGEFILEVLHEYQIVSDSIITGNKKVQFISSKIEGMKESNPNIVLISPRKVKVVIVPEISYSEDAKMQRVMQLAQAKLIGQKTLLNYLNISNVADVIEETQQEQAQQFQQQMQMQQASHMSSSGGSGIQDTADLADKENRDIASGGKPPLTPRNMWMPEHLKLHIVFIKQNPTVYEQYKDIFDQHFANEEKYVQGQGITGGPQGQQAQAEETPSGEEQGGQGTEIQTQEGQSNGY